MPSFSLIFLTKKSANPIVKLLKSAISNARNDFKVADENNLTVKNIIVNAITVLKRSRRDQEACTNQILKRTSRITIVLSEKNEQNSPSIFIQARHIAKLEIALV